MSSKLVECEVCGSAFLVGHKSLKVVQGGVTKALWGREYLSAMRLTASDLCVRCNPPKDSHPIDEDVLKALLSGS